MPKNRTVSLLIIFQILICFVLISNIYNKKNNVLKTQISISPINKDSIKVEEKNSNLKYFYSLTPNYISTDSAYFLKNPINYSYNSDGLNETIEYSIKKNINTYRIITIGDSFTYGDHVATKDNWTELLEQKLNDKKICENIDKFEVINLGACGYDPEYEVENYKLKGKKYDPNLIVWMLIDENRINNVTQTIEHMCYEKHGYKKNPPQDVVVNCKANTVDIINKEDIKNYQSKQIKKLSDYYKNKIILIDFWNTHKEIINTIKNDNYIQMNNFTDIFLKIDPYNSLRFPNDGHPTIEGHKVISEIIFEQLFKMNQITCQPLVQK